MKRGSRTSLRKMSLIRTINVGAADDIGSAMELAYDGCSVVSEILRYRYGFELFMHDEDTGERLIGKPSSHKSQIMKITPNNKPYIETPNAEQSRYNAAIEIRYTPNSDYAIDPFKGVSGKIENLKLLREIALEKRRGK